MPVIYLALHLILGVLGFSLALRLRSRSKWRGALGIGVLALVLLGFAVERVPSWSWHAMQFAFPDLVFLSNMSLLGASTLLGLLWHSARQQESRAAKIRAAFLSLPLLGVALWSYAWYFAPLPADLAGHIDKRGFCRQTSDDSCSDCAAVMLLHAHGIASDESEMARLCLTRQQQGTPPLGLYRGLAIKAREKDMRPGFVLLSHPREFHGLGVAIIAVGIKSDAPRDIKVKMEGYGWNAGQRHAVVILDADKNGAWIDVADPTYGRERWPTKDLEYLWDGSAVILTPR